MHACMCVNAKVCMHVCACHDISVNASFLLIAPISFDELIQNFAVKHPDRFDVSPFLQVHSVCGVGKSLMIQPV